MVEIGENTLYLFEEITGIDLNIYLTLYSEFTDSSLDELAQYYRGDLDQISIETQTNFFKLKDHREKIKQTFSDYRKSLQFADFWGLLVLIEDTFVKIDTIENLDKWQRSSRINAFNYVRPQHQAILKQGMSLETFVSDVLEQQDPLLWVDVAISNDLAEEDYSNNSGILLKASFDSNINVTNITSVVDVILGESIYGKDLDLSFTYENDDLSVLTPKQTAIQSILILGSLKRKDNPFFPNDGLQRFVGSNVNLSSVTFPVVFRQLANSFSTDDSLKNFSLIDVVLEKDSVYYTFEVTTRIDETLNIKVAL